MWRTSIIQNKITFIDWDDVYVTKLTNRVRSVWPNLAEYNLKTVYEENSQVSILNGKTSYNLFLIPN